MPFIIREKKRLLPTLHSYLWSQYNFPVVYRNLAGAYGCLHKLLQGEFYFLSIISLISLTSCVAVKFPTSNQQVLACLLCVPRVTNKKNPKNQKRNPDLSFHWQRCTLHGNTFKIYIDNIKCSSLKFPLFHPERVTPLIKAI